MTLTSKNTSRIDLLEGLSQLKPFKLLEQASASRTLTWHIELSKNTDLTPNHPPSQAPVQSLQFSLDPSTRGECSHLQDVSLACKDDQS